MNTNRITTTNKQAERVRAQEQLSDMLYFATRHAHQHGLSFDTILNTTSATLARAGAEQWESQSLLPDEESSLVPPVLVIGIIERAIAGSAAPGADAVNELRKYATTTLRTVYDHLAGGLRSAGLEIADL